MLETGRLPHLVLGVSVTLIATALSAPAKPVPELVPVPAGEFAMGAPDADEDARPSHPVTLDAFWIGAHEVTNEEYAVFVRATGHPHPALRELPTVVRESGREQVFRDSAVPYVWTADGPPAGRLKHPVTLVTVADAEAYCRWLGRTTGRPFRLPTEAEWEKAARGGLGAQRYPWGDTLLPTQANWLEDPKLRPERGTKPVASYRPNGLGLFDAAGNAWEWVADWYGPYAPGAVRDPRGPEKGDKRIVRGGAWLDSDPALLSVTHRHEVPADTYSYSIGFRVACNSRP